MASLELKKILQTRGPDVSTLEGNLLSAARGSGAKTIFVTSCRPGEGKTTAAVTIAHALSTTASDKVLLVDGSRSAPKLDRLFEINRSPGLIDYLSPEGGDDRLGDAVKESGYDRLVVMPYGSNGSGTSGPPRQGPEVADPGLLSSALSRKGAGKGGGPALDPATFKAKLDGLQQKFAYVVFDGDPVLTSSDASIVAKHFDGVLFVVECEKTKWEVLRLAQEKIANVGGNPLGVVLNKRRYYIPRGLYGKV